MTTVGGAGSPDNYGVGQSQQRRGRRNNAFENYSPDQMGEARLNRSIRGGWEASGPNGGFRAVMASMEENTGKTTGQAEKIKQDEARAAVNESR